LPTKHYENFDANQLIEVPINKNGEIVLSTSGLGPTTITDLEKEIENLLKE